MSKDENPFGADFVEAKSGEVIKWDEVGQTVKGQLVDIQYQNNDTTGKKDMVFTLLTDDGERVRVWERLCYREQMKQAVIGQHLGFHFVEEKPAKKKGNNPYKVIKLYLGVIEDLGEEGEQSIEDEALNAIA